MNIPIEHTHTHPELHTPCVMYYKEWYMYLSVAQVTTLVTMLSYFNFSIIQDTAVKWMCNLVYYLVD